MARQTKKQPIIPGVASNTGAYSPGMAVGDWVFVSGQGPLKRGTSEIVGTTIEEQTRVTLENVKAILEAGGCTMDDVVKVSAHLRDIKDFDRYNATYRDFFSDPLPARTTVESGLWSTILVEIDAIAVRGSGGKKASAKRVGGKARGAASGGRAGKRTGQAGRLKRG